GMVQCLHIRISTWKVWFLPFLCVSSTDFRSDCPTNWFGPNCQFKCHCNNGCSLTGECTTDGVCEGGYFGYLCQYRDLAKELDQTAPELTDNEDTTCLNDNPQSVSIQMLPGPFSFFRVVVNKARAEAVDLITFELLNFNTKVTCEDGSYSYKTELFIKYFYCMTATSVTHLVLSGNGVSYLCTVNIGGGRNLALKGAFKYSSIFEEGINVAGGVDGEYPRNGMFENSICFQANMSQEYSFYQVYFQVPVLIDYFLIINRPEPLFLMRMKNFELISIDDMNQTLMRFVEDDPAFSNSIVYKVAHTSNQIPLLSFRVQKHRLNLMDVLQFCEVEAYGDCPEVMVGLDCADLCNFKCVDQRCETSGRCVQCHAGFYGEHCDLECLHCASRNCTRREGYCIDGCLQGYHDSNCTTVCDKGTYGLNCSMKCGDDCPNSCSPDTGVCLNCPKGKFGSKCNYDCSPNCGGSGACEATYGYCTEGCEEGFYDYGCTEECSMHCKPPCSQSDGSCPNGCLHGYTGTRCTVVCPPFCGGNKSCDLTTAHCADGCMKGYWDPICSSTCYNCVEDTCDQYTSLCTIGCKAGFTGSNCSSAMYSTMSDAEGNVHIFLSLGIIIIVLTLSLGLLCRKKEPNFPPISEF
ncbi:stabilin-2-like isoform X2, partial [Biomphalaria glabrata]